MNLNTCFSDEDLFKLTKEDFEALKTTGHIFSGFAPAKDYTIADKDCPRTILVYNASVSNFFFEEEANSDIELFISNAFPATFYPKTGVLELIPSLAKPLEQLLPEIASKTVVEKLIEKTTASLELLLTDPLVDKNAAILLTTGHLKDMIACCDCGEPGCSGEYLWAEEYCGLVSFKIVAGGLTEVCLFPFRFA